jgi:hypothetical protein
VTLFLYRNGFDGVFGPLGTFLSVFPTNIRYSELLWHLIWWNHQEACAYDCDLAGDSL